MEILLDILVFISSPGTATPSVTTTATVTAAATATEIETKTKTATVTVTATEIETKTITAIETETTTHGRRGLGKQWEHHHNKAMARGDGLVSGKLPAHLKVSPRF